MCTSPIVEYSFNEFKQEMKINYGDHAVDEGIQSCNAKNWILLKDVFKNTPDGILVNEISNNLEKSIKEVFEREQSVGRQERLNTSVTSGPKNPSLTNRIPGKLTQQLKGDPNWFVVEMKDVKKDEQSFKCLAISAVLSCLAIAVLYSGNIYTR